MEKLGEYLSNALINIESEHKKIQEHVQQVENCRQIKIKIMLSGTCRHSAIAYIKGLNMENVDTKLEILKRKFENP